MIVGGSEVRTASVVLDIDDVTEEAIRKKFSALVNIITFLFFLALASCSGFCTQ